jgi:hypothetical protein
MTIEHLYWHERVALAREWSFDELADVFDGTDLQLLREEAVSVGEAARITESSLAIHLFALGAGEESRPSPADHQEVVRIAA